MSLSTDSDEWVDWSSELRVVWGLVPQICREAPANPVNQLHKLKVGGQSVSRLGNSTAFGFIRDVIIYFVYDFSLAH